MLGLWAMEIFGFFCSHSLFDLKYIAEGKLFGYVNVRALVTSVLPTSYEFHRMRWKVAQHTDCTMYTIQIAKIDALCVTALNRWSRETRTKCHIFEFFVMINWSREELLHFRNEFDWLTIRIASLWPNMKAIHFAGCHCYPLMRYSLFYSTPYCLAWKPNEERNVIANIKTVNNIHIFILNEEIWHSVIAYRLANVCKLFARSMGND